MATESEPDVAIVLMSPQDVETKLVISLLKKVGFHVLHASDSSEALERLSGVSGPPPVLIIDEDASSVPIPRLLETARSLNPAVRVLLISERDDHEAARTVRGFLKKPFRRVSFLGAVLKLAGEPRVLTA
jgi:DNA-binding NtrC family response regulator